MPLDPADGPGARIQPRACVLRRTTRGAARDGWVKALGVFSFLSSSEVARSHFRLIIPTHNALTTLSHWVLGCASAPPYAAVRHCPPQDDAGAPVCTLNSRCAAAMTPIASPSRPSRRNAGAGRRARAPLTLIGNGCEGGHGRRGPADNRELHARADRFAARLRCASRASAGAGAARRSGRACQPVRTRPHRAGGAPVAATVCVR